MTFVVQLPTDKTDVEIANSLSGFPPEALTRHIPELMGWLQDMNWPVARPVATALAKCGLALVEPIRAILQGDDNVWKYWVAHFLCEVDHEVFIALKDDVLRIYQHPTVAEITEEVNLVMGDVLRVLNFNSRGLESPDTSQPSR